jgi:hypothetical protein
MIGEHIKDALSPIMESDVKYSQNGKQRFEPQRTLLLKTITFGTSGGGKITCDDRAGQAVGFQS